MDAWLRDFNFHFTLKDCLFGGVKLAKDTDRDKFAHSGYGIGFDSQREWKCSYVWSWYELICAYW